MALKDRRAEAAKRDAQLQTSGRMNVTYWDAKKRSRRAVVVGPGTTSGLKLRVGVTRRLVDNVPKSTKATGTANSYTSVI